MPMTQAQPQIEDNDGREEHREELRREKEGRGIHFDTL